ncbi:MAG TPA: protein kinase, partial [Mycobacteriales bacterium]|nr:protein kinase [Mycobacteriales bacterium]
MPTSWCPPGHLLEARLAAGPGAETWLGRRRTDGATVVLKRLLAPAPGARERLRRDAAVVAALVDPHLLAPYDVQSTDSGDVVVLRQHLAGEALPDVLRRRARLAPPEVVTLLVPLARVVAALHQRGMVHGRIAAGNVLFRPDGRPVLTDVGAAVAAGDVDADSATPAADVVALAALGLRALGGPEPDPTPAGPAPAAVPAATEPAASMGAGLLA